MPRSFFNIQYSCIAVLTLLLVLSAGCVKQPAGSDEPGGDNTGSQEQANGPESEGEEVAGQPEIPEGAAGEWLTLALDEQTGLTQEDLDDITGYGVFQFPGSSVIGENSRRQRFPEGTEIYTLELGVETGTQAVADWYRDHLESGATETVRERMNDMILVGFEYESPDGTWAKSITLNGPRSGNQCVINVHLRRMVERAGEDVEDAEDQEALESDNG